MYAKLTIPERLKDLRVVDKHLTLEQLAEQTGLSKSALGKYETDDYKDISPFAIATLADFYGVSTDYLMGLTENKNHPNTELQSLHLSDDMVELLSSGKINNRLLCELATHPNFRRLMIDMEICIDQIANMRVEQMNLVLEATRQTVMSKYAPGKGYPNIESLKCISKFFSVTIDELLSGEELITLAETENRSNLKKIYSFIYGILDMMAVTFILLPLYGNLVDGDIYSVNLLSFTDTTPIYLAIYWIVFIVLIALGIAKLMCVCFEKESWSNIITKCSLVLSTLFICFFAAARQPYVTALMFLLFVAKIFVWIKQTQTK